MPDSKQITLTATLLAAISTTAVGIPAGPPMRSAQMARARGDVEISGLTGNFQVAIGIQISDDGITWTDETGTMALGYQSANGVAHSTSVADFTTIAGAKQFVRPCYYVKLSSGSTLATAFVRGSIDMIPRS